MRLTDRFKKAVGLWPPKAPYIALHRALSGSGDVSGLPALLQAYPDAVRWEKKGDMQPLRYALWQRNLAAAEILVEHDRSILGDKNKDGMTLLHVYAARDEGKTLQFLVHQGADVSQPDGDGRTALHHAAAARSASGASTILLKYGARTDAVDKKGCTPLMLALSHGNKDAAEEMMKKPFDARQTSHGGRTLLMAAALGGLAHLIPPLVTAGADVTALDLSGKSALDVAIDKKSSLAALRLVEAGIPAALEDKRRRKLGNIIRPLDGSEAALRSLGLRPSPKKKTTAPQPKPY
ncbi:MAG: ankyrin repeat domain-containing protein [Parvibaculum sp.]|uniref:ankyrin repeat domain-containing protein n=1 Tax=Parvibaculum sp. TaxID=2024848 RepID=UPI00272FBD26|nr:ankyrin repeat domain-containing protein [Parvibaculum sp.]MDP2148825.1 ankyrin repeat domain-containing protein [Parvibaculum sp.]